MKVAIDGVMRESVAAAPLQQPIVRPRPQVRSIVAPSRGVVGMDGIMRRPTPSPRSIDPIARVATAQPVVASTQPIATSASMVMPEPRVYEPAAPTTDPRRIPWRHLIAGLTATTLIFSGALAVRHVRSESQIRHTAAAAQLESSQQAAAATTAAAPAPVSNAAVRAAIAAAVNNFAASGAQQTGVVVMNLKTGVTVSSNPDQVFTSASLYKLFVAESVYRGIDNGSISMNQMVPGTGRNVQDCLNLMITISDNTCGVGLGSLVGWDKQISRLHTAGYTHTLLRRNDSEQTSASDVALLLKRLYDGTLLSPNSTNAFISLLKAQKVNNRLPQGLPAGTVIAHKTGDLDNVVHDAGIVYDQGGDYVIAALSSWSSPGNAPAAFSKLSADVFASMHAK